MTRDDESTPYRSVLQLLTEEGFDGFASALEILLNEAMKLERTAVLQADPERAEFRSTRSATRGDNVIARKKNGPSRCNIRRPSALNNVPAD